MNTVSRRIIFFTIAFFLLIIITPSIHEESINEYYELICEVFNQGKYSEYALYGYKDSDGSVVIPCEYTHLYGFIDGGCVATKNVTYITGNGLEPYSDGMQREAVYLIDRNNTIICELNTCANYMSFEEEWYETAQCFCVYDETINTNRVLNRQGKEALADRYSYITAYQSGPNIIIELSEDDWICIDRYMRIALGGKHFEGIQSCEEDDEGNLFYPVQEGGLIGIVNENGEYTTPPVYTSLLRHLSYPCYIAWYPDGTSTYASYDGTAFAEVPEEWIGYYW